VRVVSIVKTNEEVVNIGAALDLSQETRDAKCNVGHGVEVGERPKRASVGGRKARTTPPKMPLSER